MRVGRNPAKKIDQAPVAVEPPPPVSVGLLTHVPYVAGYHADQLDVVRLAVLSARANAAMPIHLMVFDNGSGPELTEWLVAALNDGTIDQLILNRRNLGKLTALSQIVLGAPGPDVVYSDGDLFFQPNWLEPMLKIARGIPNVGVVGGAPALPSVHSGIPGVAVEQTPESANASKLPEGVTSESGKFLDEGYMREFLADTGYDEKGVEERLQLLRNENVTRLSCGDVSAIAGAGHAHFLITEQARRQMESQVGTKALNPAETHSYDRATEKTGLLRVSVEKPVFRHVGNRLEPDQRAALQELSGEWATHGERKPLNLKLLSRTPVRRTVRKIHDWSFRALYETGENG
ncbi:MAG: glycosyltransferase [Microthrixaceae bacterium]